MGIERWVRARKWCAPIVGILTLMGCSDGVSPPSGANGVTGNGDFTISGSVGDGPIVGAQVTISDADGDVVATASSSSRARYSVLIPADAKFPLTVRISGGTDLVTQRGPDFDLVATATEPGNQTINVSPLTTLAVKAMQCADDSTQDLESIWQAVYADLDIGLDPSVLPNPMRVHINADNVETVVLANEAIGEWVRRTGSVLSANGMTNDTVVAALACDLADGAMDGAGVAEVSLDDERILAVAKAAEVAVRLEVMAGRLKVDGQDATHLMNESIQAIMPEFTSPDVKGVPMSTADITQALKALAVVSGVLPDEELVDLMAALEGTSPSQVEDVLNDALDTSTENTLDGLADRIGVADATQVTSINDRANEQQDSSAPVVSFSADNESVDSGERVNLSWATNGAEQCRAFGAWQGNLGIQGTYISDPISEHTRFVLSCSGLGGVTTAAVDVLVNGLPLPEPLPEIDPPPQEPNPTPTEPTDPSAPQPSVNLDVDATLVGAGDVVTISWSSSNAESCTASGAWSGTKAVQGSESVAVSASGSYTLTCEGPGGSAVELISVDVFANLLVEWQAPTEDTNGNPLSAIDSYRIHYGASSGVYDDVAVVAGNVTSHSLNLPPGTYYVAMTALDDDGAESALSNEIIAFAR